MMKRFLLLLLGVAGALPAMAQARIATYTVTKTITLPVENRAPRVLQVILAGSLYRSGQRYFYVERPQYLGQYPDGVISLEVGPRQFVRFDLDTDSLQNMYSMDYDSLLYRYRVRNIGGLTNYVQRLDRNHMQWMLTDSVQHIDGYTCKQAIYAYRGQVLWKVWYCADLPSQGNVAGLYDLPGLVIAGDCVPAQVHYQLVGKPVETPVAANIFWPAAFNGFFNTLGDMN